MTARADTGGSFHDQPVHGWPSRRIIWSCKADNGPLLTRYFLFRSKRLAIFIHHLHASDEDRALHDHPWAFLTFLLSSGYWEHVDNWREIKQKSWLPQFQRIAGRFWRRRFSILYRPAKWRHRLELERPVWTLVIRFRRERDWGFWTDSGWQFWKDYGKEWCD